MNMKRILITGASGTIGLEVVRYLSKQNAALELLSAVRNIEKAKKTFKPYTRLQYRKFDFEYESTFAAAFEKVELLFL
jgi:uncharacterized protein YbjT (DUF2867 family)